MTVAAATVVAVAMAVVMMAIELAIAMVASPNRCCCPTDDKIERGCEVGVFAAPVVRGHLDL